MTHTVRLVLVGAGNVGRRVMELLVLKKEMLREKLGLEFVLAGVSDSSGAVLDPGGLDPQELARLKLAGRGVAEYSGGRPGMSSLELVRTAPAEVLLEAAPANLKTGQPGLGCIEAALERGMDVVTADKAPLVLAFPRLLELSRRHGGELRFSATVGGGLPAVNIGQRDLAAAEVMRLEGILNMTSDYILTRMAAGMSYEQALAEAQKAGHAETNPSLDVEGWDAACKLVILAHSVLGYPATLQEVEVRGILGITADSLRQAAAAGKRIKPLAIAEREGGGYRLRVAPVWLALDHPLAALNGEQMGIVYDTDINGRIAATVVEETPLPTAAAVVRDLVEVCTA